MRLARLAPLASLLVALAAGPLAAVEAPVTVTFAHPETYPDLRLSCVSRNADARSLMAEIEASRGPETWRGPGRCDVRVMKGIYPPRIDLTFRLVDDAGQELRAGTRRLPDSSYLVNAGPASFPDHLRYEKALLGKWLRSELGRGARS
jgi:hypothetical protein